MRQPVVNSKPQKKFLQKNLVEYKIKIMSALSSIKAFLRLTMLEPTYEQLDNVEDFDASSV